MGAVAPSPSEGFRLSPVLAYLCYNGGFFLPTLLAAGELQVQLAGAASILRAPLAKRCRRHSNAAAYCSRLWHGPRWHRAMAMPPPPCRGRRCRLQLHVLLVLSSVVSVGVVCLCLCTLLKNWSNVWRGGRSLAGLRVRPYISTRNGK